MNVTLFDDLILVKLLPMEKVSEGGIIIPDTADNTNKKATGIVVEHGDGYMDMNTGIRQPITVRKNDKVSFTLGLGTPMNIEGEDLLLLRERDLDFIYGDRFTAEEIEKSINDWQNELFEIKMNSLP